LHEVTEEAERLAKAQRDALEAAQSAIDANVESLKNAASQAASALATAEEAARQFRKYTMENLTNVQILPDVEEELGRFESAIIGTITSIQSELQGVFRSGLIEEADFDKLSQWAETESRVLRDIGRQRDNLAKRYSLSKALISEYQDALTGSLRLVSIFNSLKSQTETTMVTEVSEGVIRLGNTLKEFGVTVTRTYEKTIDETAVKGEGLVTGFRNMAQKARDFAGNLQKLRDMGLDPQLFSELVQAGVEAGGETAQALVDGGSATILEINSLFSEINKLGAELGMDVGQTMYEAGQDMTFGLLDGIKSEQQQLYDEAKNLAQKFSEAFENNLNIAIDIPIKAAKEALEVADNAVQSAQMADIANLIKIDGLIQGSKGSL
jgi:DNA repair exonuclease SbcCD ATPase subunit